MTDQHLALKVKGTMGVERQDFVYSNGNKLSMFPNPMNASGDLWKGHVPLADETWSRK